MACEPRADKEHVPDDQVRPVEFVTQYMIVVRQTCMPSKRCRFPARPVYAVVLAEDFPYLL